MEKIKKEITLIEFVDRLKKSGTCHMCIVDKESTAIMVSNEKTNFDGGFTTYEFKDNMLHSIFYDPTTSFDDLFNSFLEAIERKPSQFKHFFIHWPETTTPKED
jgi:hypothetical protein